MTRGKTTPLTHGQVGGCPGRKVYPCVCHSVHTVSTLDKLHKFLAVCKQVLLVPVPKLWAPTMPPAPACTRSRNSSGLLRRFSLPLFSAHHARAGPQSCWRRPATACACHCDRESLMHCRSSEAEHAQTPSRAGGFYTPSSRPHRCWCRPGLGCQPPW